jgi:hypothetical protein
VVRNKLLLEGRGQEGVATWGAWSGRSCYLGGVVRKEFPEVAGLDIREHPPVPDVLQVVRNVVHHLLPCDRVRFKAQRFCSSRQVVKIDVNFRSDLHFLQRFQTKRNKKAQKTEKVSYMCVLESQVCIRSGVWVLFLLTYYECVVPFRTRSKFIKRPAPPSPPNLVNI